MHFLSTYASMGFADAVAAAKEALERQEFAILAEIDMRQILKRNLSVDLRPYRYSNRFQSSASTPGHQG